MLVCAAEGVIPTLTQKECGSKSVENRATKTCKAFSCTCDTEGLVIKSLIGRNHIQHVNMDGCLGRVCSFWAEAECQSVSPKKRESLLFCLTILMTTAASASYVPPSASRLSHLCPGCCLLNMKLSAVCCTCPCHVQGFFCVSLHTSVSVKSHNPPENFMLRLLRLQKELRA